MFWKRKREIEKLRIKIVELQKENNTKTFQNNILKIRVEARDKRIKELEKQRR